MRLYLAAAAREEKRRDQMTLLLVRAAWADEAGFGRVWEALD